MAPSSATSKKADEGTFEPGNPALFKSTSKPKRGPDRVSSPADEPVEIWPPSHLGYLYTETSNLTTVYNTPSGEPEE